MKYIIPPTMAVLFCTMFCFAQETDLKKLKPGPIIWNTDSLLREGFELHDKDEYQKAIDMYSLVNENDSNYVVAQIEIANTYLQMKKDSLVLDICKKVQYINPAYRPTILVLMAVAYENLKMNDDVVKVYKQGIKEFPLSPKFYHELAVFYHAQKKYKEAQENFMAALRINPYYTPTHYQLGYFALKQKKIIPAMLAWQFYLICDNSSKRAAQVVNNLEKIGDDAINYDELGTFDPIDQNDDFADVESIVKSKAAYSAKFKPLVNLNYRVLKQMQVVLEKIEYNESDKGFYNQYYAKFFRDLNKNGFTETYLYYALSGLKLEDVGKWSDRNKDKLLKFGDWITDYFMETYCKTNYTSADGKSLTGYKNFTHNELSGIGNIDAKQKMMTGYWQFFFPSTSLMKSEGAFASTGEKDGPWKFYFKNGKVKEICTYNKDKLTGEYKEFWENGKIKQKLSYKDGVLDGKQILYFSNGAVKGEYDYVKGEFAGTEAYHYSGGQLKYQAPVKAGKFDGEFVYYYSNGNKKESVMYAKGKKEGKFQEFYNNPKDALKSEGTYSDDLPVGEWKYYFENGKISSQGQYNKKGLKEGIWKTYSSDGIITSDEVYANGKSEGAAKNYYEDGKLYEEFIYKKNKIIAYKYYDRTGKVVKEENKQKNEFNFELYNFNGSIRRTGKTIGEDLDGPLISYDLFGIKNTFVDYKKDVKDGMEQSFFGNGQVKTEVKYVQGQASGTYKRYFSDGKVSIEGYYNNDQEEGYWFYYYHNGNLSEVNFYQNGRKTGWQRLFACNGKLTRSEYIQDGYIRTRLYYDTLGNVLQKNNYDSSAVYIIKNQFGTNMYQRPIKDNLIDGVSLSYYPNGKIASEHNFVMDQENGVSKVYDEFGKVVVEETYSDDALNGPYKTYVNGKQNYGVTYSNDHFQGDEIYYHDNGKVYFKSSYFEGVLEGEQTAYDEAGELMIKKIFRHGDLIAYTYNTESGSLAPLVTLNGPDVKIKSYYKNKGPAFDYALKYNEKDGKCTLYHSNGQKMVEENYSSGNLHGPRMTYYASGKTKTKENWDMGEQHGVFTEYYEDGKVKKTTTWLNGKKHGLCTFFDATGKATLKCYYYNDVPLKFL